MYRRQPDGSDALVYRGRDGRPESRRRARPPIPSGAEVGRERARVILMRDTGRDPRIVRARAGRAEHHRPARCASATTCSGTVEIDHFKRNAYGNKDVSALATLAAQVSTAMHIAELRRPLASTVEQIGRQVTALARATDRSGRRRRRWPRRPGR